ncbi:SdpI family protein [Rhizobium leguminosarum]|uniref:SdpI family protein n=1 Tax=Rhizobium leguminosarum TaxID=384 RepID=A0A1B1CHQ2_RHILE|nr:SdpI family protein [Rhizobium leguminosarum]ANP89305.1 hypothetical protein BA011_26410 [Rhizobium leguminosarum]
MVMIGLALFAVAPLLAAIFVPNALAQHSDVEGAIILTVLALIILGLMERWLNSTTGTAVFQALGWRCRLLQLSIVALLATAASMLLFIGPTLRFWNYGVLTAELGLLLLAGGLASMVAPRNSVIGFRTRRTLASDEIWRAENSVWGRRLALASLLVFLAALTGSWGVMLAVGVAMMIGIAFLVDDWRKGRQR